MKITGVETLQLEEHGNLLWVRLHTDEGLVGLGETFRNPEATTAYIHETCAPALIGQNPLDRQRLNQLLTRGVGNHFNGFPTRSVEIRGNSAVDIALWDIGGKEAGKPLVDLFGGAVQDRTRVYNTCASAGYNSRLRQGYNTALLSRDDPAPASIAPLDDLMMQLFEPERLAQELLDDGIDAMKIWPFDAYALRNRGMEISARELDQAMYPIRKIREAVGGRMDILIEYHGLWRLPPALRIAAALEDYDIYWHEEPVWMQNFDDVARYRERVTPRVAGSENMGTLQWYREMFSRGAVDVANFDIIWVGGITEAIKIAHLAEAHDRSIAPHDCTGPVTLLCNAHLLAAFPNGLIAETVRAHLRGFYSEVVTALPPIENGFMSPTRTPGIGAELSEAMLARSDLKRRISGKVAAP